MYTNTNTVSCACITVASSWIRRGRSLLLAMFVFSFDSFWPDGSCVMWTYVIDVIDIWCNSSWICEWSEYFCTINDLWIKCCYLLTLTGFLYFVVDMFMTSRFIRVHRPCDRLGYRHLVKGKNGISLLIIRGGMASSLFHHSPFVIWMRNAIFFVASSTCLTDQRNQ